MDDLTDVEGIWVHKETGIEAEVVLITEENQHDVLERTTLSKGGSGQVGHFAMIRSIPELSTWLSATESGIQHLTEHYIQKDLNEHGFVMFGEPGLCLDNKIGGHKD